MQSLGVLGGRWVRVKQKPHPPSGGGQCVGGGLGGAVLFLAARSHQCQERLSLVLLWDPGREECPEGFA